MTATAQFKSFGPFFYSGALVTAPHIYHYAAGTSTLKDAYVDRAKGSTVAQPLVGDSNGVASAYWDGLYKIVVMNAAETVTLYTWDNVKMSEHPDIVPLTSWTPVFTCNTPGDLSVVYTYQQGEYYQIGDLTWVCAHLIFTPTFTTAVGQIFITGAPYGHDGNADATGPAIVGTGSDPALSVHYAYASSMQSDNSIIIRSQMVGTYSNLTVGLFTSGQQCHVLCSVVFKGTA